MKVLIIGSGRMGLRHATGVASINQVSSVCLSDISENAINNAKEQLKNDVNKHKYSFKLISGLEQEMPEFEIGILASTASNRLSSVDLVCKLKIKHLLVEKPLGQSIKEVKSLLSYFESKNVNACVNLNMRLYDCFIQLKEELQNLPQHNGDKVITINTGSVGIGANGIHYIDLLFFLLNANRAELIAAEIEDQLIPSGRGVQFGDFGGWATIKFYRDNNYKGRAHLSFSASSTVFGGWEIVTPNGRIQIDEMEQRMVEKLRKQESILPVQRYGADYLPEVQTKIESPFLGDLTRKWVEGLIEGKQLLPSLNSSLKVHELLFNWLAHSKKFSEVFPIT